MILSGAGGGGEGVQEKLPKERVLELGSKNWVGL